MSYYNIEEDKKIICPYCGEKYEPSYDSTIIGNESVDCYTEDKQEFVCDKCGRKFAMYGYQAGWEYRTETIDGQMTEEEWEAMNVDAMFQ